MSIDFTAIDFETANASKSSACSVGMTRIRNGEIDARTSFYIKYPEHLGPFGEYNTKIHGITAADIADASDWNSAMQEIMAFAGSDIMIAHNAKFEASVIRSSCETSNIAHPNMDFYCTVTLSTQLFPEAPNHKLNTMAEYPGLGDFQHHDAGDDSLISALICIKAAEKLGADSMESMMKRMGYNPNRIGEGRPAALLNT